MPNRTLCDVLAEMRTCYETRNFSYFLGLIEEAQHMGNRMEAGLWDQRDYRQANAELEKVRDALKKRQGECQTAKEKLNALKDEVNVLKRQRHELLVAVMAETNGTMNSDS
jgi:predicted nuclease with TOPRIM domain